MSDTSHPESMDLVTLVFVGRLEEQDVARMRWYASRLIWRRGFRYFAGIIFLICAILLFWDYHARSVGIIILVAWTLLLTVGLVLEQWLAIRSYRQNPAKYLETSVSLTEGRVDLHNSDFHSNFRWKIVAAVAESRNGFLFSTAQFQILFWLPQRVLGDGKREKLEHLLALNKVPVYRF